MIEIEFDDAKRDITLAMRGLDMARAAEVFEGQTLTFEDVRREYSEPRYITIGYLNARLVYLVWTPRASRRRIISLRKANGRERILYGPRLDANRVG